MSLRDNRTVLIGDITVSQASGIMGSSEILNKHGSTGSVKIWDTQNLDISIDGNLYEDDKYTTTFSKIIGQELSHGSSTNIYLRCQMDFMSNAVRTEGTNFVHFGILAVNTSDELNPFGTPATRVISLTDGSHWYTLGSVFVKGIAIGMSGMRPEQKYSYKTDLETRRENQDFGRQNISMSGPPLVLTHFGTNMTNITVSLIDIIPVRTKTSDPTP